MAVHLNCYGCAISLKVPHTLAGIFAENLIPLEGVLEFYRAGGDSISVKFSGNIKALRNGTGHPTQVDISHQQADVTLEFRLLPKAEWSLCNIPGLGWLAETDVMNNQNRTTDRPLDSVVGDR